MTNRFTQRETGWAEKYAADTAFPGEMANFTKTASVVARIFVKSTFVLSVDFSGEKKYNVRILTL